MRLLELIHGQVLLRSLKDVIDVVFDIDSAFHEVDIGFLAVGWIEVVEVRQILLVLNDLLRVFAKNIGDRAKQS